MMLQEIPYSFAMPIAHPCATGQPLQMSKGNFMKKICGIYKITSPSGKIYVGQSQNILKRWYGYRHFFNCKAQRKLFLSLKKYGAEKHIFEIIHECFPSELNRLEKYYVALYGTFNSEHGLNLQSGGIAYWKTAKESIEIRKSKIKKKPLKKIEKECLMCGKKFMIWICWVKKGGGKYCNKICSDKYAIKCMQKKLIELKNNGWNRKYSGRKKTKIIKNCLFCNKKFYTHICNDSSFCSIYCYSEYRKKNRTKRIGSKSRFLGVYFNNDKTRNKKWFCEINKKRKYFYTEIEASLEYNKLSKEYFRMEEMFNITLPEQPEPKK